MRRTLLCAVMWAAVTAVSAGTGEEIVKMAGLSGGFVAHVGCGTGELTAQLRMNGRFVVHGIDRDADDIAAARKMVAQQKLSGEVSFGGFDGKTLPYIDNMVNMLVLDPSASQVSASEIKRVLAPNGACLRLTTAGTIDPGSIYHKPYPAAYDTWTHYRGGADGHSVSKDTAVGPPYHIQWVGAPSHARSHAHLPTVNVMVANKSKVFYIVDESPTKLPGLLPGKWALVARDAYNGVPLWKEPLTTWQVYFVKGRNQMPPDVHRRLVCSEEMVFATLSIHGPVSALDASTGKVLHTYEGTEKTEDIIYEDGILYLCINTGSVEQLNRRLMAFDHVEPRKKKLVAINAATGKMLWVNEGGDTDELMAKTLAARGKRLYIQNTRNVVCLDKATGKAIWRAPRPAPWKRDAWSAPNLVVLDGVVISADRQDNLPGYDYTKKTKGGAMWGNAMAFSTETGELLWTRDAAEGCREPSEIFNVGNKVWIGQNLTRGVDYTNVFDLATGELLKTSPLGPNWPDWHHHRCYRDRATEKYILAGRTGIEFIDTGTGEVKEHNWVRGGCKFGVLPANGLIYQTPDQCGCYVQNRLAGFHALAAKRPGQLSLPDKHPLVRGAEQGEADPVGEEDWPTYRADNARSGESKTEVGKELKQGWSVAVGGRLTQPVVANGRLFVSAIDQNTLHVFDSKTGTPLWRYVAGSRIDSPPTIAEGLAVFGCRDGWIYALRCRDGEPVWKYRGAPNARMHIGKGRLESVWPIHGSVLVKDSAVYYAAGRNANVDGGVRMGAVDLKTGRQLVAKTYYSRDPDTGKYRELFKPYLPHQRGSYMEMPGVLPGVMASAGKEIWMRSVNFDAKLNLTGDYDAHLFCPMGFLDDTSWELSYWICGKHFYGGRSGIRRASKEMPNGRLMVLDKRKAYGYQDGYSGIDVDKPLLVCWDKATKMEVVPSKVEGHGKKKKKAKVRTRLPNNWTAKVPVIPQGMVLSGRILFMAGSRPVDRVKVEEILLEQTVDRYDPDPFLKQTEETLAGRKGGLLYAVNKRNGEKAVEMKLPSIPVFDGLIAADKRLYMSLKNGSVVCFE